MFQNVSHCNDFRLTRLYLELSFIVHLNQVATCLLSHLDPSGVLHELCKLKISNPWLYIYFNIPYSPYQKCLFFLQHPQIALIMHAKLRQTLTMKKKTQPEIFDFHRTCLFRFLRGIMNSSSSVSILSEESERRGSLATTSSLHSWQNLAHWSIDGSSQL